MQDYLQQYSSHVVVAILLIAVAFVGGYQLHGAQTQAQEPPADLINAKSGTPSQVDFNPFWKSWRHLEEKFVPASSTQSVTTQEKVWGAIQGLAGAYDDPHTTFLPPRESEVFQENISGTFGGVGMEIGMRDGTLTVISPLEETPAQQAGLQPGDKIIEINGEVTQDTTVEQAVQKIRGKIGTDVVLKIAREGRSETFDVTITRSEISIPTIDTRLRDDGVFVISLYNFSAQAADKFRSALREFARADTNELILDLRGNTGGFLSHAVDIASWFLPAGKTVVIEDFGEKKDTKIYRSRGYNIFNDNLDLKILVNRGTASAAEIVAGALQEHGVATLVGTQTFGKGSVQELVDVTPNTSLKVTVARWKTPDGTSISQGGLTPDVTVKLNEQNRATGTDPQLREAVELLQDGE